MPPLKGIDRGLDGEALKALEEAGHGQRLAIVDASYNIPRWADVVNYQGKSSAEAFRGILQLVPLEPSENIVVMRADSDSFDEMAAQELFEEVFDDFREEHEEDTSLMDILKRTDELHQAGIEKEALKEGCSVEELQKTDGTKGFYSIANNPEDDTLFIRTRDRLPYACVTFVVGHSQVAE